MARIVLIDDESNLLRAHAMLLEHEGHEVAAGDSFAAVQQRLRPGDFDVLVCDVDLPALDGFAVLREVVEVRGCGEPVILLSDPPTMPSATEVLRRGAFDCAVKPVGNDRLLEVVARALRHVGLLRERDRSRQREADVLRNLTQLGEQAALLRHDIRSPMTSLRQALHAVGDQLGLEDMVLVEDLIRGIGRIEQLLAETLAFARPLELCRSQVQLGKVVADAVAQVRDLPVAAAIPIEQRGFAQVGAVSADPKLLVEVAVTLLRNAAEACRGKGHIAITAAEHGDRVAVDFADDGPAVPPERCADVFRPFQSARAGGTSLAVGRRIVEAHGGALDLLPRQERGVCFRMLLPRDARPASATEPTHD
jgi:signal transduction histidine kinase